MSEVRRTKLGPASAYAIAVQNGFEGTQQEWLESLAVKEYTDKTSEFEAQKDYSDPFAYLRSLGSGKWRVLDSGSRYSVLTVEAGYNVWNFEELLADDAFYYRKIRVNGTIIYSADTEAGKLFFCGNEVLTSEHISKNFGIHLYQTLSAVASDINGGVWENAIDDISTAKVKVYFSDAGKLTIQLLDDISVSAAITFEEDVELVLAGHTLSLTSATAKLIFAEGTSCSINGEVDGSAIIMEDVEVSAVLPMIDVSSEKFRIQGGRYAMTGNLYRPTVMAARNTNRSCIICDCDISVDSTRESDGSGRAYGLQIYSSEVDLQNVSVLVKSNDAANGIMLLNSEMKSILNAVEVEVFAGLGSAYGISNVGTVEANEISVTVQSEMNRACAIYSSGTVDIKNSTFNANTNTNETGMTSYGIQNVDGGEIKVSNVKIVADAPGGNVSSEEELEEAGFGIGNDGTAYVKNCEIFGTHAGISNHGDLYVSEGTYTGFTHGGFYLANGGATLETARGCAYINDALIRCGHYEGVHTEFFESGAEAKLAHMYVGGGSSENNSNVPAYLDGCMLGDRDTLQPSIVLRGSSGENGHFINISNSVFSGSGNPRIDKPEMTLKIGVNVSKYLLNGELVEGKWEEPGNYIKADIIYTDKLYRRLAPDVEASGKDFQALHDWLENELSA